MSEFFEALFDPSVAFLRYALLAGLLGSVSFGIVGSYVVTRRISYIAGAISHSVLAGIGAALYGQHALGYTWCDPLYGATIAALLSAVLIGFASLYSGEREDTVIAAVWAVGMATGLLFLHQTPGSFDPMSYLFGNILLISQRDLFLVIALDAVVIGLSLFFHNKLLAVCFDEEFARLRGIRVEAYYILLLCLVALTVVLMVTVVGIVLVIALLTLPAAAAGQFGRRMGAMMAIAVLFCAGFVSVGLAVSYTHGLQTGPTIVMTGGLTYLAQFFALRTARKVKAGRQVSSHQAPTDAQ